MDHNCLIEKELNGGWKPVNKIDKMKIKRIKKNAKNRDWSKARRMLRKGGKKKGGEERKGWSREEDR
jgi:hypothetical protein